jgi:glycosyltransferase involved in cell wall biosynthesis
MIKLTVITINYNNAFGLRKTVDSIYSQTYKTFEHIIVDGDSNDGSVDTVQQFMTEQSTVNLDVSTVQQRLISEPDTGIYNAMNKGIRMATGNYLLFLNSGDRLASVDVIEQVLPYLNNENDIVSGELELVKSGSVVTKLFPPKVLNLNYCINAGLTHPNTFIKRDLFDRYGYYNEQNKIVSDWEFFLIACGLNTCKYKSIPVLVSCFEIDGISSRNDELLKKETQEALQRLLPWWKKLERYIRRK